MEEERSFYCHDSLQPYETKHTEALGDLTPGIAGDFTISNADAAAELREKHPGMIVREHPRYMTQGTSKRGRSLTITVPRVPWETEFDRKQRARREQHAKSETIQSGGD